jgi:hypothetical protein
VAFLRVSARTAMARRSLGVAAETRKTLATRSETRPLPTFPEMQNAPNAEQARLRGLIVRRRDGLFSDWSSIKVCTGAREKNGNKPFFFFSKTPFWLVA